MADETALKDGNRNPTLLFEKDGEIKRVSNTNPLPVTGMTGSGGPLEVTGTGGGPVQVAGNVGINGTVPVSGTVGVSGTIPVSGNVGINGTVPVSGTVGISGTVPVTGTVSLTPDATLTETREQTGPLASFTLVTPAAGKRLLIKGMCTIVDGASGYDAGIRMAGGKTLHKVFRSDQQGVYVAANYLGAVNEALTGFANGMGGGVRSFFLVNYQEV
ncbi:MAG: hypothetical protein A2992_06320 [Elusimicrobia bacterium RIFCSPLOWO2_01_FULL_59_12]|nr:MAG: hypothetical protein A2992_06320 [Elusimicrobia bacterium RIFCSPLOWO2_01_FULL_59_12]